MIRLIVPPIQPILNDLEAMKAIFDLSQGVGADFLESTSQAVFAQMAAESDADGNPWPALSSSYERWKSANFPGEPISRLHGLMREIDQVRGDQHVESELASMTFGLDEQARAEAEWFQDPENPGQPPRGFYDFGSAVVAAVTPTIDGRFTNHQILT